MSWKNKPTLIRNIKRNKTYVFFDESGQIFDLKTLLNGYKKGETLEHRSTVFVLNAVFMGSTGITAANKKFVEMKDWFFGDHQFVFHNNEIDGKTGRYKNMSAEQISGFCEKLGDVLKSAAFEQLAFGAYKETIVSEMASAGDDKTIDVITKFYAAVLLRVNAVIHSHKRKHATLIFEETSQELDRLILELAVKMKSSKKLKSIDGVYFAKKKEISSYWSGMEIADLTSNGIYRMMKIHEFALLCDKLINFPKGRDNPIFIFQYKYEKNKTARTSPKKGKHSGRRHKAGS